MKKTIAHVTDFLQSIDQSYSLHSFGKKVIDAARNDETIAEKLDLIQQKMGDGRDVITEEHFTQFERLKHSVKIPKIPSAPEWLRPMLAAGYLRAKNAMANPELNTKIHHGDLGKMLDAVAQKVDDLEPDFIGEFLLQTTIAARNKAFSKSLNRAGKEFYAMVQDLYEKPLDLPTARINLQNSGGGCQACRGGQCTPISCWVIVIIIVIVIVTK